MSRSRPTAHRSLAWYRRSRWLWRPLLVVGMLWGLLNPWLTSGPAAWLVWGASMTACVLLLLDGTVEVAHWTLRQTRQRRAQS